jgi:hypothetical protein
VTIFNDYFAYKTGGVLETIEETDDIEEEELNS